MGNMPTPLLILLAIVGVVAILKINSIMYRAILRNWADENHYQIIQSESQGWANGPFFFRSKGQVVFYVTIRDSSGAQRTGYVRCGGILLGPFSNASVVRWDD